MRKNDLIYESHLDLLEDGLLFDFLIGDYQKKLHGLKRSKTTLSLQNEFNQLKDENENFKESVLKITDEQSLIFCIEKKRAIYRKLHSLVGFVGTAVVMHHWQSPAIEQVIVDNVGSFRGKIKASINDYSRDQHILGDRFEKAYRKQFIPIRFAPTLFAYATSSGMAAMTTAAHYILGETNHDSKILLGKSCYFETKQLIHTIFGDRVEEVDASNTAVLSECIQAHSPSALFIDILGNEPEMTVINVQSVIDCITHTATHHVHLVVDISARTSLKPLISSFIFSKKVSIIGVESLNKLLQFGLDRVTAGMVWGTGFKAIRLYDYRDHAGTNCPDGTITTLPTPNRKMVTRYMKRIVRNNVRIGIHVHARNEHGPFSILTFNKSESRHYSRYISRVIQLAKRFSIPLVRGTSFGLATTRIYVVAMHTHYEKPFVRISAGTETAWEIERLQKILVYS